MVRFVTGNAVNQFILFEFCCFVLFCFYHIGRLLFKF